MIENLNTNHLLLKRIIGLEAKEEYTTKTKDIKDMIKIKSTIKETHTRQEAVKEDLTKQEAIIKPKNSKENSKLAKKVNHKH